jgi:dihydroorotase
MCHNPAILFEIEKRGFVKEGYKADLVLINPNAEITVSKENIQSKCGWSPLENETFHSEITHTFVNGFLAFVNGKVSPEKHGERLLFER